MSTVLGVSSHTALALLDDPMRIRDCPSHRRRGKIRIGRAGGRSCVSCVRCGEDASPQSGEIGYSFLKVEGVASFPWKASK